MADRELRLKIGAAIDASFTTVLANVVEQVKRARKQIRNEVSTGLRLQVASEKAAAAETVAVQKSVVKTAKQQADEMAKDVAKAARERVRAEKQAMKEVERDLQQHNRNRAAAERENLRIFRQTQQEMERNRAGQARDLSRRDAMIMRAGGAAIGAGMRFASSALHGMGVQTGFQQNLSEAVDRQRLAVSISNQAWIPNGGPAGSSQKVDPKTILSQTQNAAIATGMDTNDMLQGVEKYVSHTGDLQTILHNMQDLAKLSKANGASFMDMATAASEISNEMGDIPNKGKAVFDVMRALAGQGQVTAIELRDQAKSVAMIAAQANFYKIDPRLAETLKKSGVESDTGQRIAVLGGLAQMARSKGGRVTARMAMQSSMAFMRDLANPTEIKRFQEQGLGVYADKGHTTLRDPVQMLMEAFKVARSDGGVNRDVLNRIFTNQQSRAVTNAFAQSYNEEYRKAAEAGITDETLRHKRAMEATVEVFEKLLGTAQSLDENEERFQATLKTADSQAKILNNQIGKVADEIATALLPAVQALVPAMQSFAKFLSFATGKTEDDQVKAGVEGLTQAPKVIDDLKFGMENGMVEEKTIDEAKLRRDQLRAEIARREIDMESKYGNENVSKSKVMFDAESRNETPALRATNAYLAEVAAADGRSSDTAKQLLQDKQDLAAYKSKLEELLTQMNDMDRRQKDGTIKVISDQPLKVEIVGDKTATPAGASPATSGVANPNSSE